MSAAKFYNPYHFVPVSSNILNIKKWLGDTWKNTPIETNIKNEKHLTYEHLGPASFDRYHQNTFSGTIYCRMTTLGPVAVGNSHTDKGDDQPTHVELFKIDKKPAIPASTLKGCFSAIAEAITNSALRVLENTLYSRRALMKGGNNEALSAVGMIRIIGDDIKLQPLALPVYKDFRNDYQYVKNAYQVSSHKYYFPKSEVIKKKVTSFSEKNQKYYYASENGKKIKRNFVIGCHGRDISTHETPGCQKGVFRILSTQNNIKDMPRTKKHELFLPCPKSTNNQDLLEIPESVIKTFQQLAKEAAKENDRRQKSKQAPLPFVPEGSEPLDKRNFALKEGDIVFYRMENNEVKEISFSQIWRKAYDELKTAHDFFKQINPNLLPFNPNREYLTPAELLFGFVEEKEDDDTSTDPGRCLSSRVFFRHALIEGSAEKCYLKEVTLPVLASPKPPSPNMYFRNKDQQARPYISKQSLGRDHQPQGRKFYLHHQDRNDKKYDSISNDRNHLKLKVQPIMEGKSFIFSIDFTNLTQRELGLLALTLSPSKNFKFKIGLGKPLGFGSVKNEIIGYMEIDRNNRYTAENIHQKAPRYNTAWFAENAQQAIQDCPDLKDTQILSSSPIESYKTDCKQFLDKNGLEKQWHAMQLIHEQEKDNVYYPLQTGQAPETESFKWFVQNDAENGQALKSLDSCKDLNPLFKNN
jgi:CRISPR-associated protein (TIGR03986 family)